MFGAVAAAALLAALGWVSTRPGGTESGLAAAARPVNQCEEYPADPPAGAVARLECDWSMSDTLVFERDGRDWPNRAASRFVQAAGFRWHVQVMGQGPVALLLHGTGASTHSWRDLAPLLAKHFTVIAPDLPGHAFTEAPNDDVLSLPGMAASVSALMKAMNAEPALAVGHSAGAAILIRMTLDGMIAPRGVVSLNGALIPFQGIAGQFFSPIAKFLFGTNWAARFFAWRASDRAVVDRLLKSTGSKIDPFGAELYARLTRNPGHAHAALGMMANWDLAPLLRDIPRLKPPLVLVAGGDDGTVPAEQAFQVHELSPRARVVYLHGLGHLAHEEQPEKIETVILDFARSVGALPN